MRIQYAKPALLFLKKCDQKTAARILKKISINVALDDPLTRAKPLSGTLTGKYRYRIGEYRVVFMIGENGAITVLTVLVIGHRKDVYL